MNDGQQFWGVGIEPAVQKVATELSYRLAKSFDALIRATGIGCDCCGSPATHYDPHNNIHNLCDGCWFRYTVMKAAGREVEFWEATPVRDETRAFLRARIKPVVLVRKTE